VPAFDEHLNDWSVVLADRDHQRRLLELRISCIDDGPVVEEHTYGGRIADARRCHERRFSRWVRSIRISARVKQKPDHFGVAVGARQVERRHAVTVGTRRIRACPDQQPRHLQVVHADKPEERRASVGAGRIDVGLLSQQRS
jgi:hypothetical protein